MNTLTNKDKLALQVSLALVAGMFSLIPTVQGAPVIQGEPVTSASGTHVDPGPITKITSASNGNNVINWQDFSVAKGEAVVFDADGTDYSRTIGGQTVNYGKENNYLNVVTGNGTSYIDGGMYGGKDVYLVNPNGVIMGRNADIDVGNLYVSTRDLSDLNGILDSSETWDGTASVLDSSKVHSEVVNMGKIEANSVYVEGTSIRFLNTADLIDATDTTQKLSNVTLNSASDGYVHVGYDAYQNNSYESPDTTNAATNLGYTINGGNNNFDANGKNKYDFALVENATQLQNMNTNLSLNYMLEKDIEFDASTYFEPIGSGSGADSFQGKFDGNFFSISNLKAVPLTATAGEGYQYAGLFGYATGAEIKNVGLKDAVVNAGTMSAPDGYGGALVGCDIFH